MQRLLITLTLLVPLIGWAASSDMKASSCAPNGIANSLKEKMNPKEFWAKQSTIAENALAYWIYGRGAGEEGAPPKISDCASKTDPIERQECVTYIRSEIEFWRRCGQHANRMCRLHGGFC
jgi:hypothetical protein